MSKVIIPIGLYERLRRLAKRPPKYVEDLHPLQRAFVADLAARKAALCGRRSGKSHGVGVWLLEGMERHPGRRSVYIALSRATARQILWDGVLEPLSRRYNLGLRLTTRDGQLLVLHPNGSSLWIVGCADKTEIEKLRGQKYYRACIDEAQAFPDWLKDLVEEVLEPALLDYQGQLALTGTPSSVSAGYFWEVTTGLRPGYGETHHWTVRENPHVEGEAFLQEKLKNNGWDENHPTFLREYLGQWCDDHSSLVYPFTTDNRWTPSPEDLNNPYGLPAGEYRYAMGVDLGFSERSTAFVLCAYAVGQNRVYVLRSLTKTRVLPTDLSLYCSRVRAEVERITGGGGLRIIVDEGALGKGYAEQMRALGTACEPAEKAKKRTFQEYVAGLIQQKVLLVHAQESAELLSAAAKLQWDPDTGAEDERFRARHCLDAMLYVVRALWPRWDVQEQLPKPGTREYADWQAAQHRKALVDQREKERRSKGLLS